MKFVALPACLKHVSELPLIWSYPGISSSEKLEVLQHLALHPRASLVLPEVTTGESEAENEIQYWHSNNKHLINQTDLYSFPPFK